MPRPPRIVVAGQPHHLIQRGNNRAALFSAPHEYRRYLQMLRAASLRERCAIHAYVLMTNHVHLLVTPNDNRGLARLMQTIGRLYVCWFNARHQRTGTLLEGRYRSTLVTSERYFLTCSRYIELNPVRAGMVARPDDYPWSSFRCNARGLADPLISPHALYESLAGQRCTPQAAYRRLFENALDDSALSAIRIATNRGRVLDGRRELDSGMDRLGRRTPVLARGGDRRSVQFRNRALSVAR